MTPALGTGPGQPVRGCPVPAAALPAPRAPRVPCAENCPSPDQLPLPPWTRRGQGSEAAPRTRLGESRLHRVLGDVASRDCEPTTSSSLHRKSAPSVPSLLGCLPVPTPPGPPFPLAEPARVRGKCSLTHNLKGHLPGHGTGRGGPGGPDGEYLAQGGGGDHSPGHASRADGTHDAVRGTLLAFTVTETLSPSIPRTRPA